MERLEIAWQWASGNHGPAPEFKSETTPLMVTLATLAGWRVLLVTGERVRDGRALAWLSEALRPAVSVDSDQR